MSALADIPAVADMAAQGARFVLWYQDVRNGKPTKVPIQRTGRNALSTEPATWCPIENALEAAERLRARGRRVDGIGFVLDAARDGIAGVDLDGCRNAATGAIRPWATTLVRELNSYTEVSPSGTGVKVFVRVDPVPALAANKLLIAKAADGGKDESIEVYTAGRYFALTGEHLDGTPDEIADATEAFERLAARIAREAAKAKGTGGRKDAPGGAARAAGDGAAAGAGAGPGPSAETMRRLAGEPPLARLWRGEKDRGDASASGMDWSLARALGRAGVAAEEIARVVRAYPHGQVGSGKLAGHAASRRLAQLLHAAREAALDDTRPDLSHDGLALALGEKWADQARHVALWGRWLFWTGTKWEQDEKLLHLTRTRDYLRRRADGLVRATRAGEIEDLSEEQAEAVAKTLRSAQSVAHVVGLARSNPGQAASVGQWDKDPWLLGTPGGTVDLRTGLLRPAVPGDHITKTTAVTPAPAGTPAPLWQAFLERVFRHDPELIPFMRRVLGYALTGLTTEHVLVFAWGQGANGKSTLFNTASRLLGDYATVAPADLLLVTHGDRHPTDLAMMRGARLVTAQELAPGKAWDEPKLKGLTGGDPITARFMRQDFFTYEPQFTLVASGNHKPSFKGVDEAIRRRVALVPFLQNIPPQERDKGLPEKLLGEGPAILRWAIDGCLDWQKQGLNPPKSVREASEDYLSGEDVLGQWLEERCVVSAKIGFTQSTTLYADWREWCADGGLQAGSTKAFSQRLDERGFTRGRDNRGKGFIGIGLRVKPQHDDSAGCAGWSDIDRNAGAGAHARTHTSHMDEPGTSGTDLGADADEVEL